MIERSAMLEEVDDIGWTALHWASAIGSESCCKVLLQAGADVNVQAKDDTPLMCSAFYGHFEVVKLFLTFGAEVNKKNSKQDTPIMFAAMSGHNEIVKLLLESGADANMENNNGNTPLVLAAMHGRVEIVKLLLKSDANGNMRNVLKDLEH